MEHEEQAERLEHEAEDLEERSERVDEHIQAARQDWEEKEEDSSVPGAQPDPERSDQLPEEGPGEQVYDDTGESGED
jgi:hypothetical protein